MRTNSNKFNWRINQQIKASEVRVIDPNGKQIGVMRIDEALSKAKKLNLDLVEIAPKANPPVVKIVDLGKFKYEQEKKQRKNLKKARGGELKEIRLTPFIAEHDLGIRMKKINKFLDENNKVKIVVVFTGKQMESKNFGYELLKKINEALKDRISIDMEPKFLGRHLAMVISPLKKGK